MMKLDCSGTPIDEAAELAVMAAKQTGRTVQLVIDGIAIDVGHGATAPLVIKYWYSERDRLAAMNAGKRAVEIAKAIMELDGMAIVRQSLADSAAYDQAAWEADLSRVIQRYL